MNGQNTRRCLTVTTDLIPVVFPPHTSHLSAQPKPKRNFSFQFLPVIMSQGALYFSISLTCQGLSLQDNDRLQTAQRCFVLVIGRMPDSWKDAC